MTMPAVYATQDDCKSDLGKLMQSWRAMRPDEWTMDEFIREAEKMHSEIIELKKCLMDAIYWNWLDDRPAELYDKYYDLAKDND